MKNKEKLVLGSAMLSFLLVGIALAHQITTTSTISFSPSAVVTDGTMATITGNVAVTGSQHTAPVPPIGGTIQIQECMAGGVGIPASNCSGGGGTWTNIGSGAPDASGNFAVGFDATGLTGSTIGFRSHYVTPGGGHAPATSSSPGADLTIVSACNGLQISADLASGDGMPAPGSTGPWTFRIKVKSCEDATSVFAQGGSNGWAPMTSYLQSTGTVTVRENKKNQVLRWTIGDMTAGQEETLSVSVDGKIPQSAPCDSIRYLSGNWSAVYSTDGGLNFMKSDYTGRVSITVTC